MKNYLFILAILICSLSLHAEVITDGSLGLATSLPGPDYLIDDSLGQQLGSNLFHSLQTFNLNASESATFTGPNSVANILTRVTGGNSSFIDGTIRSEIPNANLYLLNPNGILFGEHASLDIQGSFHASTADYLRLGETGRFSVSYPNQSLLTVAPPHAFGFLSTRPGTIDIQNTFLQVPSEQSLSVIGGDLTLENATLQAASGRINLIAVASPGDVIMHDTAWALESFDKLGKLTFSHSPNIERQQINEFPIANIDTSGVGGGQVFIRSGEFLANNAWIFADTLGDQTGQNIDLSIQGPIALIEGARITADTMASGQGGTINIITTDTLTLAGQTREGIPSSIATNTFSSGQGGEMTITATNLEVRGGVIQAGTGESGNAGNIRVRVNENLLVSELGQISVVASETASGTAGNIQIDTPKIIIQNGFIDSFVQGTSQGGKITIDADQLEIIGIGGLSAFAGETATNTAGQIIVQAKRLTLRDGGFIDSTTLGAASGGNINIKQADTVLLVGIDIESGQPSLISSGTLQNGQGGTIQITTKNLILDDSAEIQTATFRESTGIAGNIAINAEHLNINNGSGIIAATDGSGQGGDITLEGIRINLNNDGLITAQSLSTGNAGTIRLNQNTLSLNDSAITTQADYAGGGSLSITTHDFLQLFNSKMTAHAGGLEAKDHGGNITLTQPQFAILNNSQILASANVGNGGNIDLTAEKFIPSSDSLLDASSKLGIDGEIHITAGEENFSNSLVALTQTLADASKLLAKSCVESARDDSYFVVAGRIPENTIPYILNSPQPPSFKDGLPQSERLALYYALQAELATAPASERQSAILAQLAALYASEHRFQEALQLNQQALKALNRLNAPYWRYKWQWQRGRLFHALGEHDNAIIAYQTAVQKRATLRQQLTQIYLDRFPNGERSAFREVLKPLFTELVALLLELSEPLQEDSQWLKTALQTMDQLKSAELQDYFQDDCTKPTTDLEQVDSRHTAIIYPIFLPNQVKLLVSLPQAQRFLKTVPATPKQLTQTINTLSSQLNCQDQSQACPENHSYRFSAQKLYDWLIRPLEPVLSQDIHTLVFVPDGPLYAIPMAVLHDGQQFLIEKYALAVTPSLTITKPTTHPFSPKLLYTALTASKHPDFPPIQTYVTRMQADFEALFGTITTLTGPNFIQTKLSQVLHTPHTITHVFSHAQFSPNVSDSCDLRRKIEPESIRKTHCPQAIQRCAS
ncbi:MAG TPA: filamentous hemagglutinin N-terminal domain-containing protein [Thiotrichaceae bacterium]|nr:filamentous hemagglutinin N-terminal domain-containing protein [Thiotrichaceae bacterium]